MKLTSVVNRLLAMLHSANGDIFLRPLIYFMYKLKGKDVRSVRFLSDLNLWEFQIGNDYFLSPGPGWTYDYEYLLRIYRENLGWSYVPKLGDVVIDVGAGVGEELMVFSRLVGEVGKVFAVEAHPQTFQALRHNLNVNKLSNAKLINKAIGDVSGSVFIEDYVNALSNKVSNESGARTVEVDAITIDDLVRDYGIDRVDFMKVNIEGAEQLLIKGTTRSIDRFRNIAISCHDFRYQTEGVEFFKTKAIILEFLQDQGFNCQIRHTGNQLIDDYVYASSQH